MEENVASGEGDEKIIVRFDLYKWSHAHLMWVELFCSHAFLAPAILVLGHGDGHHESSWCDIQNNETSDIVYIIYNSRNWYVWSHFEMTSIIFLNKIRWPFQFISHLFLADPHGIHSDDMRRLLSDYHLQSADEFLLHTFGKEGECQYISNNIK